MNACSPKSNWWGKRPESRYFPDHASFDVFLRDCKDVMMSFEGNLNVEVSQQLDLYHAFKSQSESFNDFFDNFEPSESGEADRKRQTCDGRAVDVQNELIDNLMGIYPGIENQIFICSSVTLPKDKEVEFTSSYHVTRFIPHCVPALLLTVAGRRGVLHFEQVICLEEPCVVFEDEPSVYQCFNNDPFIATYVNSDYLVISRYRAGTKLVLMHFAYYIGGSLLNMKGTMKIACLPIPPVYKYLRRNGKIIALIVARVHTEHFKFFIHNKKENQYDVEKYDASCFLPNVQTSEALEELLQTLGILFKETVQHLKEFLGKVARIKYDREFIAEANLKFNTRILLNVDE